VATSPAAKAASPSLHPPLALERYCSGGIAARRGGFRPLTAKSPRTLPDQTSRLVPDDEDDEVVDVAADPVAVVPLVSVVLAAASGR